MFGYAIGMNTIAFRLREDFRQKALATGGDEAAPDGEGWAAFKLFRSDWPEVDTRFWARKAYVFARKEHAG